MTDPNKRFAERRTAGRGERVDGERRKGMITSWDIGNEEGKG